MATRAGAGDGEGMKLQSTFWNEFGPHETSKNLFVKYGKSRHIVDLTLWGVERYMAETDCSTSPRQKVDLQY